MQRIADEIGDVINKHINIMDELGVIIASTDISRIGMLYGGARRIISWCLPYFLDLFSSLQNYSKQFLIPNIFKCVFIILKINNMQKVVKK